MNAIDFCFWLQGYFELAGDSELSAGQAKKVKEHLDLVFVREIDPLRESQTTTPAKVLNETHTPLRPSGNDPIMRC
tara:strand:+ start:156 stop:383 length:228 start_codon:yes stop_codon:yes gene_type:complete